MRRYWTLQRTVHDRKYGKPDGEPYTYRVPRVLRIRGVCALHGFVEIDTAYWLLGLSAWRADPDDGGSAGVRFGIGPLHWVVYVGRLLSKRAVRKRLAAELIQQTEQHLRDVTS